MARRRTTKRRRRSRTWSLINALEAYTYANILSSGVAGTSPWGLLTGKQDLMESTVTEGIAAGQTFSYELVTGADQISLADIISQPGLALSTMTANFNANMMNMAIQSAVTAVGFRFGKRLLRRPISNVNRNIMKPLLGAGIRL